MKAKVSKEALAYLKASRNLREAERARSMAEAFLSAELQQQGDAKHYLRRATDFALAVKHLDEILAVLAQ